MRNEFYFRIPVLPEQIAYTDQLVEYSLKNHKISNIWDNNPDKKEKTKAYRFTGSLGEVVFADTYGLARPKRSFGAIDGQDDGQDFLMTVNNMDKAFDIKSMHRKTGLFRREYVLNIPASQLFKSESLTNYYFCISFHTDSEQQLIASFLGYIDKKDIESGQIGILFKAGSVRQRYDHSTFQFNEDTYEIEFKDICTPFLNDSVKQLNGFKIMYIK